MDAAVAVLKKLKPTTLEDIVRLHYEGTAEAASLFEAKRKELALAEDALHAGLNGLLSKLSLDLLKRLVKDANLECKTPHKIAARKALLEHIADDDEVEFFENLATPLRKEIAEALETKSDANEIVSWVVHHGLTFLFKQFAQQELSQWCLDSGLQVDSTSKPKLIECLITQTSYKKEKKKTPKKTNKDKNRAEIPGLGTVDLNLQKRPELKKGITAANAYNYYKSTELREFLKKHDASYDGRMNQLALRVVEVLEGKYVKPESKKRKRAGDSKKKAPAKKARTTATKRGRPAAKKTESK